MKLNSQNVPLEPPKGSLLVLWCPNETLRRTYKKSKLPWKCNRLVASKNYNDSLGEWQPLIALYPGSRTWLPFFKTPDKASDWTDGCEKGFPKFGNYINNPPALSWKCLGEPLYIYLAMLPIVASSTLTPEDGWVQKPIYYTNRALQEVEHRSLRIEKLCLLWSH